MNTKILILKPWIFLQNDYGISITHCILLEKIFFSNTRWLLLDTVYVLNKFIVSVPY